MKKLLKVFNSNLFLIFFATSLFLFSFTIFSTWVAMVCIWFGLFFCFRFTRLELKLSPKEHNLYLATVLLYPLGESLIKWMMIKDIIAFSWFLLNRLEHFSWAVAMVIIFLPTYTDAWKRWEWWQALIYVIGLIGIIGNLNEFMEYFMRVRTGLLDYKNFGLYYWDTIYDMIMNMLGSFVGFVVVKWNHKKVA